MSDAAAIPDGILKFAEGATLDLELSAETLGEVKAIIAKAIHDAVMAERRRCEVAVAMACRVGKYTPLSEYIASIRATPKAEEE